MVTSNLYSIRSSLSKYFSSLSTFSVPSHDHIASLILDQKSASQALQTFKWASDLPGFTHSQSTYRALIHKLCAFQRFDTVNNLLDEMPSSIGQPPDDGIFVTIIRGLGRGHRVREVFNFLDLVLRFHETPSLKIFNSVLDALVKENIDLAREFYRKKMMASGVQGDDYTFGILMKGLCSTNRIGDGFKLLQIIKSTGATPNTVIYNTLVHALCKNGKVGRARSLMNEMKDPTDVTFNILISAYCEEDTLVQALVLLEKSFKMGFVPDVVTVTKVLQVLCDVGRVSEGLEILERVESKGGIIDVFAYNTLIKGYCRLGKVKVGRRLLKEMERKGCLANVETYNTLISSYCESGMMNLALDMFEEMKRAGINRNFRTFDVLIRGLCTKGKTEDGLRILELMEETKGGSSGSISPYNSVLYGFYSENRWEEALDFLFKMERMFPKAVDRSLRILRFSEAGNLMDATRVYDQMTTEGQVPSVLVFNCLIHGFCALRNLRDAFRLMNEMVASGYIPNGSTILALVSGFCDQGKARNGLKLVEDMVRRGYMPCAECYRTLIEALCKEDDLTEAAALLLKMIDKGIVPNFSTWNLLLLCLSHGTEWLESYKFPEPVNNLLEKL